MDKSYCDVFKEYEKSEHETPSAHMAQMLNALQVAVDKAYQDGYEAAIRETTS